MILPKDAPTPPHRNTGQLVRPPDSWYNAYEVGIIPLRIEQFLRNRRKLLRIPRRDYGRLRPWYNAYKVGIIPLRIEQFLRNRRKLLRIPPEGLWPLNESKPSGART